MRTIMTLNGDSEKKIWATEYGAPTAGDTNGDGISRCDNGDGLVQSGEDRCVSEAAQAQMFELAIAQWRSFDWAGPLFWYSYQDLGTGGRSIEQNFGMLRTDGSRKPIALSFRKATGAPDVAAPAP
jgi:hypothetical protein